MHDFLHILAAGGTLAEAQAETAMHLMMQGEAEPEEIAGLLMGLRTRGETVEELVGFTRIMRKYAVPVACEDSHAIDLCGTGGDGTGTFNISTVAAFVCAGAGVTVAKHGNRSVSSQCGSADVLDALGVRIDLGHSGVETCLHEAGIAFLFAPLFHPAMRFVMPVRKKLAVRTFFNILGPLCNPAGVRRQLVGAFSTAVAEQMAHILSRLDAAHVVTVHAEDGLDELSLASPSRVFEYDASQDPPAVAPRRVEPEDHGLGRVPLEALRGGGIDANVRILRGILDGLRGPHRDVVVLNAAYALQASGRFTDLEACFEAAEASIDGGGASASLNRLITVSNQLVPAA